MKNVEDIYPLSPMQASMLLHARHAAEDTLFSQFSYELTGGDPDRTALHGAWSDTVKRHAGLRTMFAWKGLQHPVQIVRQEVDLEFQDLDWSDLEAAEQDRAFERWRAEDRDRGFALDQAPLTRVALIRRGTRPSLLIWSSHHLVLDRWCIGTVLNDVHAFYAARRRGEAAEVRIRKAPGFRNYIGWLQAQDEDAARALWGEMLRGAASAARTGTAAVGDAAVAEHARAQLDGEELELLRARARELRTTTGVIVQAAWALVLHGLRRSADVIFGTTVSGRPADLPEVESIVGTFINNVPVRVRMDAPDTTLGEWLHAIHRAQQARAAHEFVSTAQIHELSGVAASEPLFDTLLVSLAGVRTPVDEELGLRPLEGRLSSAFPATLGFEEGSEALSLQLSVEARRVAHPFDGLEAAAVLDRMVGALRACSDDPSRRLSELDGVFADIGSSKADAGRDAVVSSASPLLGSRQEGVVTIKGREAEELELLQGLLLDECRTLLGRSDLGLEDGFFESGGDSLLAARLHVAIETVVGRAVPQLALFEAKTIGGMAQLLAEGDWPVVAGLVRPLRPQGSRTPLFCISSPEVNSMGYVLLARHLDPDLPIHLVQSPPRTDRVLRMSPSEIPKFAEEYVRAVLEVQPSGTFRLLGMCGGGMLAFEMARILRAAGHRVDFVGVLNTFALHTLSKLYHLRRAERRMHYYGRRLRGMLKLGFGDRLGEIRRVVRRKLQPSSRVAVGSAPGGTGESVSNATELPASDGPTIYSVTSEWLMVDWPRHAPSAPTYDGTVTVFRTRKQNYFRIRDRSLGWKLHAKDVELRFLGTARHLDVLREPYVVDTARVLSEHLDALDSDGEQSGC